MTPQKHFVRKGRGRHVALRSENEVWNILGDLLNWKCVFHCVCVCVSAQDSRTKAERQSEVRIKGSEIVGGRECVRILTHQGHPEPKCDWKSPVCLGCLAHDIIQTGCSADNVTVLTTPPFSFCFKLCEMAGMWECHSHACTHTSRRA